MQYSLSDPNCEPRTLDHSAVDWQRVQRCRYLIQQQLHYNYTCAIYDLQQRLMILPPERYGNQQRSAYRLDISLPATRRIELDRFGNTEIRLAIPEVEQTIKFDAWIQVERWREESLQELPDSYLSDPQLLEPSALTQPNDALRAVAAQLLMQSKQGIALAHEINCWVYQHMQYAHDVTTIHSTAADALLARKGVCQDYAHLMLALCHLCALPARYVSGHLLGEGGTHAWVEVLVHAPDHPEKALVVPLDPTHGRSTHLGYVTISVGRDYYDVAPTSGTFRGACRGELSAYKRVSLTYLE